MFDLSLWVKGKIEDVQRVIDILKQHRGHQDDYGPHWLPIPQKWQWTPVYGQEQRQYVDMSKCQDIGFVEAMAKEHHVEIVMVRCDDSGVWAWLHTPFGHQIELEYWGSGACGPDGNVGVDKDFMTPKDYVLRDLQLADYERLCREYRDKGDRGYVEEELSTEKILKDLESFNS